MQKANLIFGMGMLEMGITFSFKQLILDSAMAGDIKKAASRLSFPQSMNQPGYVQELVAMYKGEAPAPALRFTRSFWQDAENRESVEAKANAIANEIINTHKGPAIDRSILNEMRRIVLSAE